MENLRIVFDCMGFLQALISKQSIAFRLFEYLDENAFTLFVSNEILDEMNDVLNRPYIRAKNSQITDESVGSFFERVLKKAVLLKKVPVYFELTRDPKDEKYVNLAVEAKADYIVTRDKDLLDLMTGIDIESKEFRQRFRPLRIVEPIEFLKIVQENELSSNP